MTEQWKRLSGLFAAKTMREKWFIALAALAAAYALTDLLWLTPSINRWQSDGKTLAQKNADLMRLSDQVTLLETELQARERQTRESIAAGRRDLGSLADELAQFERTLVPARRMTDFLHGLLPGRGLEVVALRTLAPQPLVTRAQANAAATTPAGQKAPVPPPGDAAAPNLYRHGVEITLAGSYPALLEYLDRLEKSPQKVMFGRLELRSDKYPRSEMTLTLYTLSLDRSWLIV